MPQHLNVTKSPMNLFLVAIYYKTWVNVTKIAM